MSGISDLSSVLSTLTSSCFLFDPLLHGSEIRQKLGMILSTGFGVSCPRLFHCTPGSHLPSLSGCVAFLASFWPGTSSQNSSRHFLGISAMQPWPRFWLPSGHTWKNWNLHCATIFDCPPEYACFFFEFLALSRVYVFSSSTYGCYLLEGKSLDTRSFLLKAKLCNLFPILGGLWFCLVFPSLIPTLL